MSRVVPILAILVAVASCGDDDPIGERVCGGEEVVRGYFHPRGVIDILVVVDRTPSMADAAVQLDANARAIAALLAPTPGDLPDIHLAVVTSDLGVTGVAGCGAGDGARFQGGARCGLDGEFLAARGLVEGGQRANFTGAFGDTLACLLAPPLSTCPVSQPLGAAVRALGGGIDANAGFRRPFAPLAVVIITDGDDCTLATPDVLAGITGVDAADLEGAVDFACFARGTRCTPADPAQPGRHDACTPRSDAGLADAEALIAQLGPTEGHQTRVVVVRGGAEAEVVAGARLAPVCDDVVRVGPAPRLASSLPTLGSSWPVASACAADWSDAMAVLGYFWQTIEGPPCISAHLDLEPDVPGVQLHCAARLATFDGETVAPLPMCSDPGVTLAQACILPVVPEAPYCPESSGFVGRIKISTGDEIIPGAYRVELRCEVPCTVTPEDVLPPP